MTRRQDIIAAVVCTAAAVALIASLSYWPEFLDWAFERHRNLLSWYIRPLFLIPFGFFAYRHSLTGIAGTILALVTSMFWFNSPDEISPRVADFLRFERQWLAEPWSIQKTLMALTVPLSLGALAIALWKRSLLLGCVLLVLMAGGKVFWSLMNTGAAGVSILIPAVSGLGLCLLALYYLFRPQKGL